MAYDEKLCNEKHKTIDEKLEDHEIRLNNHSERLKVLEQDSREHKTDIKNLIKKMDDFISTIKWGLGIFVTVSIFVMGILLKK
ncbi:hemolysin XhlA family protein [Clostridium magnum]|uniref:Hemolysin XhlA n=1 Tax=Clostridium magnum DSM 2767 TaxID=1121326 RepID=A0A161Y7K0_9CLOT|nr:hemolysin XhlA family protein [Clostridium magnum]KZL94379.1 hemolysin XhlA [Clostridium magnum DSM 2767]SHJ59736.1 Haemolysin XhlA [Clostridium magnum DSM 2767]